MRKAWVRPTAGILAALCLSGCGRPAETVTPESAAQAAGQSFDVSAAIKMGGVEAEADLNRTEEGVCTFQFRKPEALSGMTVALDRDTIRLSYLGLSVEADSEKVLGSSMTKAIVSAINAASEPNGITVGVEGSAIRIDGETEAGEFTLQLDQKEQSMLTLSIPNLDLECHFSSGRKSAGPLLHQKTGSKKEQKGKGRGADEKKKGLAVGAFGGRFFVGGALRENPGGGTDLEAPSTLFGRRMFCRFAECAPEVFGKTNPSWEKGTAGDLFGAQFPAAGRSGGRAGGGGDPAS